MVPQWPRDWVTESEQDTHFRSLLNEHLDHCIVASEVLDLSLHCVRTVHEWIHKMDQSCKNPWAGLHCYLAEINVPGGVQETLRCCPKGHGLEEKYFW